jgi:hypothetical protein
MKYADVPFARLNSQHISTPICKTPHEVVHHMVAMQAQDYPGALWSIGLRMSNAVQVDVEKAILDRQIVRTWPMRGTLHFVAAEDIRWLLQLLTPREIAATAARRRNLEIDDRVLERTRNVVVKALQGGIIMTRNELFAVLETAGISTASQRGYHLLHHLSQEALICFGPHNEKQPTFVLLDEWIPHSRELGRDEALAELTERFFKGHGPATLHDLVRWTGMTVKDARQGLEAVASHLGSIEVEGQTFWMASDSTFVPNDDTYLLPGFDEYILGYKDRSLMLETQHSQKIVPGNNGMFLPTIIASGQVAGTWKRVVKKDTAIITLLPFASLTAAQHQKIAISAKRYGDFLGKSPILSWNS